jgi:hypothetical protein
MIGQNEELNDYVLKAKGISRASLNVMCFIGVFIFGWLQSIAFAQLGKSRVGWFYLVLFIVALSLSVLGSPALWVVALIIYIVGWIHANVVLSRYELLAQQRIAEIDRIPAHGQTADILLEKGLLQAKVLQQPDRALPVFFSAIRLPGGDPQLLKLAGDQLAANQHVKEAQQLFDQAAEAAKYSAPQAPSEEAVSQNLALTKRTCPHCGEGIPADVTKCPFCAEDIQPEMTRCPYCAEDIRVGAKKCKHCGEWIEKPAEEARTKLLPTAARLRVRSPQEVDKEITQIAIQYGLSYHALKDILSAKQAKKDFSKEELFDEYCQVLSVHGLIDEEGYQALRSGDPLPRSYLITGTGASSEYRTLDQTAVQEIARFSAIDVAVVKDIVSGRFSERDIVLKYAIKPEQFHAILERAEEVKVAGTGAMQPKEKPTLRPEIEAGLTRISIEHGLSFFALKDLLTGQSTKRDFSKSELFGKYCEVLLGHGLIDQSGYRALMNGNPIDYSDAH